MVRGYVYNADIWASVVGKNFGIAACMVGGILAVVASLAARPRETRLLLLSELTYFHLSHFPR